MKNYKEYAVIAAALCAFGVNAATLTWTGEGGDNNWTTAGNWTSDSGTIDFAALDNSYYFCDVPNNTTITIISDLTVKSFSNLNIANLTLTNTTGEASLLKITSGSKISNTSSGTFSIAPNCTLDFNCPASNPWSDAYNGMNLVGGGILKITKDRASWGGNVKVKSSTLVIDAPGSGIGTGVGFLGVQLLDDGAIFEIGSDTYTKNLYISDNKKSTVRLNGHTLYNVGSSDLNAIAADFEGDASSRLVLMGGKNVKLIGEKSMSGTYELRNAMLHFGSDATHPGGIASDALLKMYSQGVAYLYSDRSLGALMGNGVPAYVSVPEDVTLTVTGESVSNETSYAGRIAGAGNFVKDGADYKLVMSGNSFNFTGNTTVKAGTLELKRPMLAVDSDIVYYWPFDGDDYLVDKIAGIKWNAYTGQALPSQSSGDGVYGDALLFDDVVANHCNLANDTSQSRKINVTNFTVSIWVKPSAVDITQTPGCIFNFGAWPTGHIADRLCLFKFVKSGNSERIMGYSSNPEVYLSKSIVDGKWHHIAYVHEEHKIALWLDGKLAGTYVDNVNKLYVSDRQLQLGAKDGWGRGYSGGMDELIIANGSWDEERIVREYKRARKVGEPVALPTPAAKWTFDENLVDDIGGVELVSGGTTAVAPITRTAAYGKCVDLTSASKWLEIKDGDPYPFPTGNQPFTISIRYQGKDSPEYVHAVSIGDTSTARRFIGVGFSGSHRGNSINWTSVKSQGATITLTDQNNTWSTGAPSWEHIVVTSDGSQVRTYRAGALVSTYNLGTGIFNLTANMFNMGHYQDHPAGSGSAYSYVDDFRVWTNCCLTAEQVVTLARTLENGEYDGQFKNSSVEVKSGATLKAVGVGNEVKKLNGAGTVEIDRESSLSSSGGEFSGTLSGGGRLTLTSDADFSGADASGFDGYIEVKGGEAKLNSSFAGGIVTLNGGAVTGTALDVWVERGATISHNGATPTVPTITTTGKLTLPEDLTIEFTGDAAPYGEVIVATAGELVMPASTEGWTIPTGYTLRIKDNKLRMLSKLGAVILLH